MSIMNRHKKLERHSLLLTTGVLVTVAIGGGRGDRPALLPGEHDRAG